MILLKDIINPLISIFPKIQLYDKDISSTTKETINIAKAKKGERHHIIDSQRTKKRFTTGYLCEVALEKFLRVGFVNLSIGPSKLTDVPDLWPAGLRVGVKGSDYTNYNSAVVPNTDTFCEPQVIVLKLKNNVYAIAGYADENVIRKYRSDYYVGPTMKNNDKTGFYGYRYLKQFNSWKELIKLAHKYQAHTGIRYENKKLIGK